MSVDSIFLNPTDSILSDTEEAKYHYLYPLVYHSLKSDYGKKPGLHRDECESKEFQRKINASITTCLVL